MNMRSEVRGKWLERKERRGKSFIFSLRRLCLSLTSHLLPLTLLLLGSLFFANSACADTTTGLLAYGRMDDSGATVYDSSGHGSTGAVVNNPASVSGKRGLARSFNGTSQYVNAGDIASLDGLTAFTLAAWIK